MSNELDSAATKLPAGTSAPELAEELAVKMRGINGTEEVELFGDPTEEIVVEVDAPQLAALGLSAQSLAGSISASDAKVTAGQLRGSQQDLALEVQSELETLEQIRQIPIQTGSGQFARLDDIAQVRRGMQQPMTDVALVSDRPTARGLFRRQRRRLHPRRH